MTKPPNPFRWFDSSPEVIRLVVMMYVRYPLSLRDVEDHPDDILIDARAGVVIFNGPVDDNQEAAWDQALERRTASLHEIEEYKRDIENEPELRQVYEDEIAHEQRLADLIGSRIPDEQTRRVPGFNIHEWREKQHKDKERRERWRQIRDSGSA